MQKLDDENREKAAQAIRCQRKKQTEKEQEHTRKKQREEILAQQKTAAAMIAACVPLAHERTHLSQPHQNPLPRKRKVPCDTSPQTTQPQLPKRRPTTAFCRTVWGSDSDTCDSFIDIALKEGDAVVHSPPPNLAVSAMRDGLTIVGADGTFCTMEGDDPWLSSNPWSDMTSNIVCSVDKNNKKVNIESDGGLGLKRIGAGTFNVVVKPVPCVIPDWLKGEDIVYRITRPDSDIVAGTSDKSYKYQTLSSVAAEADNAMFASKNNIGVRVHSIASYHGVRQGRTLRYGTVYALDRADLDLLRVLDRCRTFDGGALIAVKVTELLFKASRCGVAFFDIKPGNILSMATRSGHGDCFRLTDYDPAFFIRLPNEDWRTLMLLNLALLAAHVRNQNFDCTNGFCAAVAPILRQLVHRRSDIHNSDWLFDVRSVCIPFEVPENTDVFQMQRIFAVMATSYFYNKDLKSIPSSRYAWETKDQSLLDNYWLTPKNRYSWPPLWHKGQFKPLIEQLVEFALTEPK